MNRWIRQLRPGREGLCTLSVVLLAMAAAGCAPKIGDKCVLSTDCSQQGTLVCDTSQPSGYCTQLNCTNGSCPNDAVCVEFQSSVPGCAYDDYQSPSRTGRAFCMAHCSDDSNCRQSDGYVCSDPTGDPWNAAILGNNQSQKVCIVAGGLLSGSSTPDAAVCMSYDTDAARPALLDAGTDALEPDAEGGAAAETGGPDAADAGGPVELDAGGDSGLDATLDAPDAGSADAPGGG